MPFDTTTQAEIDAAYAAHLANPETINPWKLRARLHQIAEKIAAWREADAATAARWNADAIIADYEQQIREIQIKLTVNDRLSAENPARLAACLAQMTAVNHARRAS
jgi:hypothetical protein